VGLLLAVAGLAVIASHLDATLTVKGLALILAAAFFWACANMVVKTVGRVDMLGFMVWTSLFAVPPLLGLSLWLEGPQLIQSSIVNASVSVWACVLWQAVGNTLFGYGAWNWLLARHPAATVTPMALLVPVFGMGASALSLGEPLPAWKLGAGALVLCGLVVIVVWPRLRAAMVKVEAA
jgi:O-acetylserine/cysteine efflux transporter